MFGRGRRKKTAEISKEDDRPWKLNFHIGFENGDARTGKTKEVALLRSNFQLPTCDEIIDASTTAFTKTLDRAVELDLTGAVAGMRQSMPRVELELTPD
jgi:hypothetical protein